MVKLFIPILLIGLCFVSDLYLFLRYINSTTTSLWKWTWWIPLVVLMGFFVKFLFFSEGLAKEYNTTNLFLLLMVLICIPKILFSICSLIPKVGIYLGFLVALGIVYIVVYGITIGFTQLKVRHVTFESSRVPEAFDGYKIVQFSDAHTGSFRGPYAHLLKESVDSINAQQPDLVCFIGDIENFTPEELVQHREAYSAIKAKDGVMTIMGNHDYSTYMRLPKNEEDALVQQTRDMQRSFGWDMLINENRTIRRGADSLYIIGEENWGLPPFPQYGDIKKACEGIITTTTPPSRGDRGGVFTLMLSHDPNAWRHHILPVITPDITLSGHTHGTQFSIFGWSPSSMIYEEWGGEYYLNDNGNISRTTTKEHPALLNVSTGFGGNFPFRFNMPREIVVITLKKKNTK
ncbi:MAG: metallophosphoesterase [Prevotella sp.]|nr:metallophosphoesterase [Prevotella sp.]